MSNEQAWRDHEQRMANVQRDQQALHQNLQGYNNSFVNGRANGQPYFKPGAARELHVGLIAAIFGPIIWYAGKGAYDKLHVSKAQATMHGMYCAVRWKVWAFTVFLWISTTMIWYAWAKVQGDPEKWATDYQREVVWEGQPQDNSFTIVLVLINLLTFIPAIAVTYCQAVDVSFFKERLFYRMFRPFHLLMGRVPWQLMHMVVLTPFVAMAIKYN